MHTLFIQHILTEHLLCTKPQAGAGRAVDYVDTVGPKVLLLNYHLHQQVYFSNYRVLYVVEFKVGFYSIIEK